MRIGLTYNLKEDYPKLRPPSLIGSDPLGSDPNLSEDAAEEWDRPETLHALKRVIEKAGHEVFFLGGDLRILPKIKRRRIQFVFNIAEGLSGRSREAHVPSLLELSGVPYSGSDPLALALTLDKALTKRIAMSLGIPTPRFWIVHREKDLREVSPRYPLFVKPCWEGSSKGIRFSSKVGNRNELARECRRLFRNYGNNPLLVEAYVPGREVTVGVLGNERPSVLGMMEIRFRNRRGLTPRGQTPSNKRDFCYSLEVKRDWEALVEYQVDPPMSHAIRKGIEKAALDLFQTLGLRDVARFDFRIGEKGFYFLEVNPLPGLSPESGDIVLMAYQKGWTYEKLVLTILNVAFRRYK